MSPLKVAVIGAGMAGLATARVLKNDGHEIVIYERSNKLGGTWVYDPRVDSDPLSQDPSRDIVNSSLYPSLRTNLPRQVMGFSDYPFRIRKGHDSGRVFPGHAEVLQFLNEFVEEFGLVELIRFSSEVVRVEPVNDEWIVECKVNGSGLEEVFDAVVVCNGHYNKPRVAHVQGIEKWKGEQLHSHNYRGPEPFRNKVVVVIGFSASGFDISREISDVAKEVHVSARPSPLYTILKFESKGNIWRHSETTCVQENGEVSFQDGSSVFADIIFHCTGFEFEIPFLKTDGIVTVDENRVGPLYKHVFPPKLAPRLSFIGLTYMSLAVPTIDLQAKWLSHILSGNGSLPSEEEMMASAHQHYTDMEEQGIPKRHTHRVGFEVCFKYLDSLAAEVGLSVDEELKLTTRSYLKFVIENGFMRAREWEPDQMTDFDSKMDRITHI